MTRVRIAAPASPRISQTRWDSTKDRIASPRDSAGAGGLGASEGAGPEAGAGGPDGAEAPWLEPGEDETEPVGCEVTGDWIAAPFSATRTELLIQLAAISLAFLSLKTPF